MRRIFKRLFFMIAGVLIISQGAVLGQELSGAGSADSVSSVAEADQALAKELERELASEIVEEDEGAESGVESELESEFEDRRTEYTPAIPKIEIDEAIDTLYPDPLSKAFREKNKLDDREKTKSVAELLDEFEAKAAQIASDTVVPEYIEDKPKELDEEKDATAISQKKEEKLEDEEVAEGAEGLEEEHVDDSEDYTTVGLEGDEIMVDDGLEPLPDMVMGAADLVEDLEEDEAEAAAAGDEDEADAVAMEDGEAEDPEARAKRELREALSPLVPALLADGDPAKDQSELTRVERLVGVLVPEAHPVARRGFMFRWAVKGADGALVPIRSNLGVLKAVADEELLDAEVEVTGHYQTSAINSEMRYFIATEIARFVAVSAPEGEEEAGEEEAGEEEQNATAEEAGETVVETAEAAGEEAAEAAVETNSLAAAD
jgi:hypothetical protein